MKERKTVWLYSLSGDYLAVRERLNALAAEGWEMDKPADGRCLVGRFQRTRRKELCYDVEIAPIFSSQGELQRTVDLRAAEGWEAVCTINGMNIYCSMPCRDPQTAEQAQDAIRRWRGRGGAFLLFLLLGLCLSLGAERLCKPWYGNNISAFFHLSLLPLCMISLLMGIWVGVSMIKPVQKTEKTLFFHIRCGFLALLSLWWLMLAASILLTLLPVTWAAGVALGGVVLHLLLRLPGKLSAGCTLLLAFLLSLLLPMQQLASVNGTVWREQRSDIVTAERLHYQPEGLIAADYEKTGSLLVQCASYSEKWRELRVESRTFTCLTEALARQVEQDLAQALPSYTVVRSGRVVIAVWTSDGVTAEQAAQAMPEGK